MPEKTRPYDPELDGEALKLIPMSVMPPKGTPIYGWRGDKPFLWRSSFGVEVADPEGADGWFFEPSTPEPEKSYAGWVKADRFYYKGIVVRSLLGDGQWIDADELARDPEQAKALRDWLNEKFPIQDTLAEQEAGE